MASAPPFPLAGEAAALASSVFWAGAGIAFRRLRGRVSPIAVNFAKNATAAALLALTLAVAGLRPSMSIEALGLLALSGLLGLTVCDTFLLRAMMEIGPRRATLIAIAAPCLVFVGVLLPPFSQFEQVASIRPWAGLVLAIAGVALAASGASPERADAPSREAERRGVRDAFLAALFQAAGFLLARAGIEAGAAPLPGTLVRLVAGTVGLVAVGAVAGELGAWRRALLAPEVVRTLAVAAFFGTYLGIGLNQLAIAWSASTGVAAVLNSLAPVWLIPLSAAFLGERPTARGVVATGLALVGVALLSL